MSVRYVVQIEKKDGSVAYRGGVGASRVRRPEHAERFASLEVAMLAMQTTPSTEGERLSVATVYL